MTSNFPSTRHAPPPGSVVVALTGVLAGFGAIGHCEVRSSTDYAIEAEGFDPSFAQATSADYQVEASVDVIGGGGGETVTNTAARNGFKGALYEVTAVAVMATPAMVGETSAYAPSTTPLSGTATYNDSTVSALAGDEIAWTIDAGPITSISGAGLATAGMVSGDAVAGFSGSYSGMWGMGSLTVLDTDDDNFGGYADDGLPDWWQIGAGLSAGEAGPDLDPDRDGRINREEFAQNLDPLVSDLFGAPQAAWVKVGADWYFTVTFRRNKAASNFVELSVMRATDLVDWSAEGVVLVSVTDIDAETESVTVRSSIPMHMQPKEFLSVVGKGPYVAMTFDDGPHPTRTPRLLDILLARNIKATFFTVGTNAGLYPQILQRMVNEGHEIGNHTQTHPDLSTLSDAQVRAELDSCHAAIVAATGVAPVLMRPPFGALTQAQRVWIPQEYGYRTVFWDVDPLDWQQPGAGIVADRIVPAVGNGSVVLSHDIHSGTIDAMPLVLDRLLAKGYQFVTVSELDDLITTFLE